MARQREKLACTGPRPLLIGYTATKAPGECPGLADWIKRWRQRRARQGLIHAFFSCSLLHRGISTRPMSATGPRTDAIACPQRWQFFTEAAIAARGRE
jgi:hypothetical protein